MRRLRLRNNFSTRIKQQVVAMLLLVWSLLLPPDPLLAQSTTGSGYDPLSSQEMDAALNAAFAAGVAAGADSIEAASVLRQEVLLVERRQESKAERNNGVTRRRSDTYIYDYTTDTLKHVIVDLDTQEAELVEEVQHVQLPLTNNEIVYAYYLAFSNQTLKEQMNASFLQITGEPLETASQLEIKSFIFTADAMPDAVNEFSEVCGLHRCAQLLLYTTDNTILDVQPIIDLSRGIVAQDITGGTENLYGADEVDPDLDSDSGDDPVDAAELDEETQETDPSVGTPTTTSSLFLPFVARRFLKNGQYPAELILDQVIFALWCDWMNQTEYADGLRSICTLPEASK